MHTEEADTPERLAPQGSLPEELLPRQSASELAHAILQRECDRLGVDVLFLKGAGAHIQGLRPPKQSSDVDILLAPKDRDRLLAFLRSTGWSQRPVGHVGVALDHAVTLYHPRWPIDIDIHRRIPGFGVPAEEAFEALHRRSVEVTLAHWSVTIPHRVDHALLLALNTVRSPWEHQADSILAYLSDSMSDTELTELGIRIKEMCCGPEMAPFTAEYSRGLIPTDTSAPSREWMLYQRQDHPAVLWLDAIQRAPWHLKPALAIRAAVPSSQAMAADDLELTDASVVTLARRRYQRFAQFVRSSPAALRSYREFRRSLRTMPQIDRERRA